MSVEFGRWLDEHEDAILNIYAALRQERGDSRPVEEIYRTLKAGFAIMTMGLRGEGDLQDGEDVARYLLAPGIPMKRLAESSLLLYKSIRQVLDDKQPESMVEWLGGLGENLLAVNQAMTSVLADTLEGQKTKVEMLYGISRSISAASDEQALLRAVGQPAIDAGATAIDLFVFKLGNDGEPKWMEKVATWPEEGVESPVETHYHLPEFPLARLYLDDPGKPRLVADVTLDEEIDEDMRLALAQMDTRAMALVPLTHTGRWVGAITFQWNKAREFSQQEAEVYDALVGLVTPAVEARRVVNNLEQMVAERTAEVQVSMEESDRLQREIIEEVIEAQKQALQELSTPIIPVIERILVMPLIGSIDSARARDITRALLAGIREHRAQIIILDITGVPLVDSGVASHLNKTIQAARLKGAHTIITGVSDAVAETIVDLGIDWSRIDTLNDLQTGLHVALNIVGLKLVSVRSR